MSTLDKITKSSPSDTGACSVVNLSSIANGTMNEVSIRLAKATDNQTLSYETMNSGWQEITSIDYSIIEKFVDSVAKWNKFSEESREIEEELQRLLEDATIKTAFEEINLKRKGHLGNKRFAQISKRLSLTSKEISESAMLSRNKYYMAAK